MQICVVIAASNHFRMMDVSEVKKTGQMITFIILSVAG